MTEAVEDPLSAPVVVEVDTSARLSEKKATPSRRTFFGASPKTVPSSGRRSSTQCDESDSETDNFSALGLSAAPPTESEVVLYDEITAATVQPHSLVKPEFQVCVTDPRRADQPGLFGLNSTEIGSRGSGHEDDVTGVYTQYKVITTRRDAEVVVWRRFREFVSLDAMLVEKFRGYIVPPRPEKNAVEAQRMKGSFIQERRLALEKYLNKLANHPEIKNSEV